MEKINGYWVDENNNKWNVRYYTENQAMQHSKSLTNCTCCENCKYCKDCVGCKDCANCTNCFGCESRVNAHSAYYTRRA